MKHWMLIGFVAAGVAGPTMAQINAAPPAQWAAYLAETRKTIVALQPFRQETAIALPDGGTATLINLNPTTNASFLLQIGAETFHIDNGDPAGQRVSLVAAPTPALEIDGRRGAMRCDLGLGQPDMLAAARQSGLPFAPLCNGRLYLRNTVSGSRSNLESVTDFLRDNVWGGEQIVRAVRDTLYRDQYAAFSELREGGGGGAATGPRAARIDDRYAASAITPVGLGLPFATQEQNGMRPGAWYAVAGLEDVFVSALQPRAIAGDILSGPGSANPLDGIEGQATAYFVAFDIDRYGLGYALGTEHPRLDWSPRPQAAARIPGLPGPDGIGDARPLVRSGMVSPDYAGRTVATFTAGFKRAHGAFRFGAYAATDTGKHYGFIEKGVIYSKLKTGLSTLYVLRDGRIEMGVWTAEHDGLLPDILFARQNGLPLVETDPASGQPMPGSFVNQWGPGNWSGSAQVELRTLRAAACRQDNGGRRFLIYGYFSTATPSAMARTFQAYGCLHAMLLDMNALEHTYLALYPHLDGQRRVQHLIADMAAIDKSGAGGRLIPRFLAYPDNRDVFFVYDREAVQ